MIRRSPVASTRPCRRSSPSRSGPTCWQRSPSVSPVSGFSLSPTPATCPADPHEPGGGAEMTTRDVDVVVLGLGPGGEHAAIKLGRAGLDVVAVESRLVGGECPYYGCVPSKMMIAAAHMIADVHKVARFGGTAEVEPDWSVVAGRIRDEATDDWDDAAAVKRLEDNGARFVRGRGVLMGPGTARVGGT